MPATFLAHQLPVLALKLRWPRLWCGVALVVGSMAPDLEYCVTGDLRPRIGHTLAGQFLFCLPLTLVLVWLVRRVVARPLAAHLPDAGGFHLRDVAALADAPRGARTWLLSAASALVGSFSHVFLDGFTHERGFAVMRWAALRETWPGTSTPAFAVLQYYGSLLLCAGTVLLAYVVGRRRLLLGGRGAASAPVPRSTPWRHAAFWGVTVLVTAAGTAIRLVQHPTWLRIQHLWVLSHLILQVGGFGFVGLCAAALLLRERPATQGA